MRKLIAAGLVALAVSGASAAEVVNVEFKFTPFVGDPVNSDQVRTVAGRAEVFLNGVPYAEQEVGEEDVPVIFDEREIAPSVWVPTAACGPVLRKGKNVFRIVFEPADPKAPYRAQLRWASVMNEATEDTTGGGLTTTNQSGDGVEDKEATGKITLEREFQADFATDLPWHHQPAVTSLGAEDRAALAELVASRVRAFQPDFAGVYALMEGNDKVDLAGMKSAKCLEHAYEAGARVRAPSADQLEFLTTGHPEVVIQAKKGMLFFPADMSVFEKITDENVQMCLGMALSIVYPPRLVVVRSEPGKWVAVY